MAQIDSPHDAPSEQSEGREINPMEARLQQAQLEYLEAQRDVLRNQISTAIARRETLRTVASMLSALSVVVGLFALAFALRHAVVCGRISCGRAVPYIPAALAAAGLVHCHFFHTST